MDSTAVVMQTDSTFQAEEFAYPHLPSEPLGGDSISILERAVTETLLGSKHVDLADQTRFFSSYDWLGYVILGLLFLVALLWYFMPDRLLTVFYLPEFNEKSRSRDTSQYSPGLAITSLLSVNFVVTLSLFLFLAANHYFPLIAGANDMYSVALVLTGSVVAILLLKVIVITITGFLFGNNAASSHQRKVYTNINNLLGILLLPILFVLTNWMVVPLLILGIILIIAAQIVKWYASFFIVISQPGIFVFHIIVYLCTLEFVPLLVLFKLLNNSLA